MFSADKGVPVPPAPAEPGTTKASGTLSKTAQKMPQAAGGHAPVSAAAQRKAKASGSKKRGQPGSAPPPPATPSTNLAAAGNAAVQVAPMTPTGGQAPAAATPNWPLPDGCKNLENLLSECRARDQRCARVIAVQQLSDTAHRFKSNDHIMADVVGDGLKNADCPKRGVHPHVHSHFYSVADARRSKRRLVPVFLFWKFKLGWDFPVCLFVFRHTIALARAHTHTVSLSLVFENSCAGCICWCSSSACASVRLRVCASVRLCVCASERASERLCVYASVRLCICASMRRAA